MENVHLQGPGHLSTVILRQYGAVPGALNLIYMMEQLLWESTMLQYHPGLPLHFMGPRRQWEGPFWSVSISYMSWNVCLLLIQRNKDGLAYRGSNPTEIITGLHRDIGSLCKLPAVAISSSIQCAMATKGGHTKRRHHYPILFTNSIVLSKSQKPCTGLRDFTPSPCQGISCGVSICILNSVWPASSLFWILLPLGHLWCLFYPVCRVLSPVYFVGTPC